LFRSLPDDQSGVPCLPPPGAGLLLRALLKRTRPPAARTAPTPTSVFVAGAPSGTEVERYNAALGFAPGSVPLTWFYLMVQRAHLATLLAPAFPYRLVGMVHAENGLVLHGEARGTIRLSTRVAVQPPTGSGAVYCALETAGSCAGEPVFTCTSTYLAVRGRRGGGRGVATAAPDITAGAELGSWHLPATAGRAYARVSGDWNPIHLAGWTARLMGLREPIIHGMHPVATACVLLEARSGRRVTAVSVRFRAPVPLGSTVVLAEGSEPGSYALHCDRTLAADGRFVLG
jgi:hypothetical protein